MDDRNTMETMFERRMTLLHVLVEDGVAPAVMVPLFELLATESSAALGPDHELTAEADLGADLCQEAARSTQLSDPELLSHAMLLTALDERLRANGDALGDEVRALLDDIDAATGALAGAH